MENKIDYLKLYKLQDEVLKKVYSTKTDFYLTGGTALNRLILDKNNNTRYSDDLDFFIEDSIENSIEQRESIINLLEKNFDVKHNAKDIASNDFKRISIEKDGVLLQVDFVNDVVKRFGESESKNGFLLDNKYNILTNKIRAIISRDEIKDIFDLYLLNKTMHIDWIKAIEDAREKTEFQPEDFCQRLIEFPKELIYQIKTNNREFLNEIKDNFDNFIKNIRNGSNFTSEDVLKSGASSKEEFLQLKKENDDNTTEEHNDNETQSKIRRKNRG